MNVKSIVFVILGLSVPFLMTPMLLPDKPAGPDGGQQAIDGQMQPGAVDPNGGGMNAADPIGQAQAASAGAAIQQASMDMQACYAQQETFVGCEASAGSVPVEVQAQSFVLYSGTMLFSYDATTGQICKSTASDPSNCAAW